MHMNNSAVKTQLGAPNPSEKTIRLSHVDIMDFKYVSLEDNSVGPHTNTNFFLATIEYFSVFVVQIDSSSVTIVHMPYCSASHLP